MARLTVDQAYPGISIRPRSRRLWARLMRWPAECIHLENGHHWMATFIPDTLYLRGKARPRREPARPEVSVCFDCLAGLLEPELAACPSRVVAFEPDGETFHAIFFPGQGGFRRCGPAFRSGRRDPDAPRRTGRRVQRLRQAGNLAVDFAAGSFQPRPDGANSKPRPGRFFAPSTEPRNCARPWDNCEEANLFYVNAPYGESGAYIRLDLKS